jgi:hypothetical protein
MLANLSLELLVAEASISVKPWLISSGEAACTAYGRHETVAMVYCLQGRQTMADYMLHSRFPLGTDTVKACTPARRHSYYRCPGCAAGQTQNVARQV